MATRPRLRVRRRIARPVMARAGSCRRPSRWPGTRRPAIRSRGDINPWPAGPVTAGTARRMVRRGGGRRASSSVRWQRGVWTAMPTRTEPPSPGQAHRPHARDATASRAGSRAPSAGWSTGPRRCRSTADMRKSTAGRATAPIGEAFLLPRMSRALVGWGSRSAGSGPAAPRVTSIPTEVVSPRPDRGPRRTGAAAATRRPPSRPPQWARRRTRRSASRWPARIGRFRARPAITTFARPLPIEDDPR